MDGVYLITKELAVASQAYDEGSIPFTRSSLYSNIGQVQRVSGCSQVRCFFAERANIPMT